MDLFLFKQKSQDFMVEEQLPFQLAKKGDALFVLIEKRNSTTMDILNHLKKRFGLSRQHIGIAGLKDKDAITRQWFSIWRSALTKCGGEFGFINALAEVSKVLESERHTRPLEMRDTVANKFFIRLRAKKHLGVKERESTEGQITKLYRDGFANYFGPQRFGVNGRNIPLAKDVLDKKTSIKDKRELQFKLQAYSSFLFNQFVKIRTKKGGNPLEGELYLGADGTVQEYKSESTNHIPTPVAKNLLLAPVPGWDLRLPPADTVAGKLVDEFLIRENVNDTRFALYGELKIYGLQRPWWVYPSATSFRWEEDDLILQFTLPGGSYASVMIGV